MPVLELNSSFLPHFFNNNGISMFAKHIFRGNMSLSEKSEWRNGSAGSVYFSLCLASLKDYRPKFVL
jgi:hypothetical protein